ncbi:MerR family transcriptional regulator [Antribacter sp. KLBMP9083]|uniref:MerR family transcriptional regulator n=1 Tax=Antribacter soli TaxID=2910976 RepID=A0AA41QF31_9MICO|nr:MerR family transcriptional regulator [Antribacter soli]MCF4120924.1 MerR family transcriptional regulator [Antribacter soli]
MDGQASSRRGPLRSIDVARESGYSVQQVRDLERLRVIPPATRSAKGYRRFAAIHVQALRGYRGLAQATGPVVARRVLAELRSGTIAQAAAAISEVHAGLGRERAQALRAQEALRAIEAEATASDGGRAGDAMTITELAAALGVRPSTLRYWEQEGLVNPERVTSLRARRYGPATIGEARIVAALRGSGYGIPAVREITATLHRLEGVEETRRILDRRLDQIGARTVALLRAGADLAAVVEAVQEPTTATA